ncbi:DNA segregation protein PrgO [Lactiplantibacillus carotarum]|uniref:DNA segregation protein PrgO n=1 Tax=Lactiplantibacillus carotarum TaxID=2993456 RepID=UPI00247A64E2|nr:DNA segregation protein PrgO [Lactiplantibacillus carotarum]
MGLLNRSNIDSKNKLDVRNEPTKIDDDSKITYGEKNFKARDRKPIQVDPPVLELIQNLSYAKDMPMYKVVDVAMNAYLATLTDSERAIYDMRQEK